MEVTAYTKLEPELSVAHMHQACHSELGDAVNESTCVIMVVQKWDSCSAFSSLPRLLLLDLCVEIIHGSKIVR